MLRKFPENVGGRIDEFAAAVHVLRKAAPKFLQFLWVLGCESRYADACNRQSSRTTPLEEQHCRCRERSENQRLFPVHLLPLLNHCNCATRLERTALPTVALLLE